MITSIKQFNESLIFKSLRTPFNDMDKINIDLTEIKWDELEIIEDGDNNNNIIYLKLKYKNINFNNAIILDVQIIQNILYQIHISIIKELHGLGLGYKIFYKFINEFGHIYSGNGRRLNDVQIPKIYNKLKQDKDIEFYNTSNAKLFISKKIDKQTKNKIFKTINV